MIRWLVIAGAALAAAPAFAQAVNCDRVALEQAVQMYLAAQTAGDPQMIYLAPGGSGYSENREAADIATGILASPLNIDFSRSMLDEETCETFTEVIVTDSAHPYVLGVRTRSQGPFIDTLDILVSDADDWLFDADVALQWMPGEDWGEIPEDRRDTRETLIAAATAYYDRFNDPSVAVPFGEECYRLEGGIHTGAGPDAPANSCGLGMLEEGGVLQLVDRHFIADPVTGSVVGFSEFGAQGGEPDTHLFRVNDGRIRYVHAITACSDNGCDFGTGNVLGGGPPPD